MVYRNSNNNNNNNNNKYISNSCMLPSSCNVTCMRVSVVVMSGAYHSTTLGLFLG